MLNDSHQNAIKAYNKACVSSNQLERIDLLILALKFNSDFLEAHYNIGLEYLNTKDSRAITHFKKALVVVKRRNLDGSLHEQVAQAFLTACLSLSEAPWNEVDIGYFPRPKSNARVLAMFLLGLFSERHFRHLSETLIDELDAGFSFSSIQLLFDMNICVGARQRTWIRKNRSRLHEFFCRYPVSSSRFLRRNDLKDQALSIIQPVASHCSATISQLVEYFLVARELIDYHECEHIIARLEVEAERSDYSLSDRAIFIPLLFWYQQQDFFDQRVWKLVSERNKVIPKQSPSKRPKTEGLCNVKSIGFMSSDFRRHSISYFILELVRWLMANRYRVVLFHGSSNSDEVTELFKRTGALFVDGSDMSGEKAVKEIQRHDLDCLIDLNGWTSGTALHLFRDRLARVQGTYLGYAVSTGYEGVEFRITDQFCDPGLGSAPLYSEQLLRMQNCFLNYSPIDLVKAPRPRRSLDKNAVKFCSTNHPRKFNQFTLELWGQLLAQMPGSTLTLKHNDFKDVHVIDRVKRYLVNGGCSDEQLSFVPRIEGSSHLDFYDDFDFLIDTFPYTGTTTTMEALWSGCPVVTIEGDVHRARVTASILRELGLQQCIFTPDSFVPGVIDLLSDFDGKVFVEHAELQARIKDSTLGDVEKFGPQFMRLLNDYFTTRVQVG